MKANRVLLCTRCFYGRAQWRRALDSLKQRINELAIDASLVYQPPPGSCLHVGDPFSKTLKLSKVHKFCVCNKEPPELTPAARVALNL